MGFLARFGLDARGFIRGMDQVEKVAEESTRRMVTRHRTQIDTMRDRERAEAKRRADFQRDFARGWQVATVAAAAGIAAVVTSLDAAAQRNPIIAQQMGQISSAAREMRANIGEDLFGLGGRGIDDAIRKIESVRGAIVDIVAATQFGASGQQINAVNDARAADRAIAIAIRQGRTFNQLQLELKSAIGGDQLARNTLLKRRDNQMISEAAKDAGLTREQAQRLRELADDLRLQERFSGAKDFMQQEREQLELQRMELRAEAFGRLNPNDPDREIDLEYLRKDIALRKARERIEKNELLDVVQKRDLLKETTDLIEEQSRMRRDALRMEAAQRERAVRNRVRDTLGDDRIALLRATGQDRLAEVEALELGFSQRRRDIENDRELTREQKNELISSGANTLRAQLRKLREGGIDGFLEAGLAGGATLRRQILGADGRGGGESPVIQRIDTIINLMNAFIDQNTVAVAAP